MPWPVAVFGPTSQELLHDLGQQPTLAWQGLAFLHKWRFFFCKTLGRATSSGYYVLTSSCRWPLQTEPFRNVPCMGDLAKSYVLVLQAWS